MKLEDTTN